MSDGIDLGPAAAHLGGLVRAVPDGALGGPTPCEGTTVGDLLDHIGGLTVAFTAAATKERLPEDQSTPRADAASLAPDWRERIPAGLERLVAAWREPAAWEGTARAGGLEMPAEVAALVTLDELVVHGWDLARSTGQAYEVEPASLEAVAGFVRQFSGPGQEEARAGLFGPEVEVPHDAPLLDRVLGMTGRDPGWSPG